METPLARVRGLGAAGHGGADWWAVRVNSVALLLLSVWLLVSLLRLPDLGFATLTEWLRGPITATLMLLLIVTTFWHIKKGLKESIDDYVDGEAGHVLCSILLSFFVYGGGALAVFCVARIALGGGAA